jgi:hypothetical protein
MVREANDMHDICRSCNCTNETIGTASSKILPYSKRDSSSYRFTGVTGPQDNMTGPRENSNTGQKDHSTTLLRNTWLRPMCNRKLRLIQVGTSPELSQEFVCTQPNRDKRHGEAHICTAADRTCYRLRLKCDGTRAETTFRLSPKRTSPFKSAKGVSSVDCWQPRCAHQR